MGIMDLFKKKTSGNVAKDRLKLVLVSDRANCSSEMMEMMKNAPDFRTGAQDSAGFSGMQIGIRPVFGRTAGEQTGGSDRGRLPAQAGAAGVDRWRAACGAGSARHAEGHRRRGTVSGGPFRERTNLLLLRRSVDDGCHAV